MSYFVESGMSYFIDMKIQGSRIRLRRQELGLTQHQLAEATDVSQGSIARLEQSKEHDARTSTLHALAVALKTTPEYLCGMDEPDGGHAPIERHVSAAGIPETIGSFPGYREAEKQARLEARDVPEWVWVVVRAGNPLSVGNAAPSVAMLTALARFIMSHGNASSADEVKKRASDAN
jgi:transcriptional regulator with XRE-family HTH domain